MEIAATPDNRALASAVNARLRSDSRIVNAKAALWRLLGVGIMAALTGVGLGAACYGYSYIRDESGPADHFAQALEGALNRVTLKTDGTVKLDPGATLAVAQPSQVPKPSATQLGSDSAPASNAAVMTNFTVFKNVPVGQGQVVTGWNFTSSDQQAPNHQYCYYSEQLDGTSKVTIDLGENGHPVAQTKSRTSVDPVAAYANCVWFKGGAP